MGSKSDYLEGKLLDHVLGGTAYSAPATVYVALYTATPSDAGGGAEATGGGYARVAVTNNTTNWPNAVAGVKSNGTALTFPIGTSGGVSSGADMTHWGVFDASTNGNLLIWGALTIAKKYLEGDTPSFPAGALTWTED
jgi:hypothetical protein